ncbi:MAG: hypothetical protein LBL82_07270 [Oscillospiraceae bacterium]|jgi:hypothetical protein|nr:hypothetical protein [Oscillospiraceae bacterium]
MDKEALLGHLSNVLYTVIYLVVSAGFIFLIMWLYVRLKKWYKRATIAKQPIDLKTEIEYIEKKKKELNFLQRLELSQTGRVYFTYSIKYGFLFIVSLLVVGIIFLLIGYFLAPLFSENALSIFFIVDFSLGAIIFFFLCCYNWDELVEHARLFPFLFSILCFIIFVSLVIVHAIILFSERI